MRYIVKKLNITEKQFSIDGKAHRRTIYFSGVEHDPVDIVTWDYDKRKAEIFTDRNDAERFAYAYDGQVVEI